MIRQEEFLAFIARLCLVLIFPFSALDKIFNHQSAMDQSAHGLLPLPADTKANDLWHWQTTLVTKDIAALTERLRKAGAQFITPEAVAIPQDAVAQLGFKRAILVRDPTGHALRLVEE